MYELALFAGAGGGLLASQHLLGFQTVCYVEIDAYCVEILKARIRDGLLDDSPIWDDVRSFYGQPWHGKVDLITAGFPCQPWSTSGRQQNEYDDRNLWPDTIRIIREVRPGWIFLENVPALISGTHGYYGQILADLAQGGYDVRWDCIPAIAIGAPHQRDRLWVVARSHLSDTEHAGSCGCFAGESRGKCEEVGRSKQFGGDGGNGTVAWWDADPADAERAVESGMGRVADGLAHRVDRLRAIGNGQVSAVAAKAWCYLKEMIEC